jgi:hypothetical protein
MSQSCRTPELSRKSHSEPAPKINSKAQHGGVYFLYPFEEVG